MTIIVLTALGCGEGSEPSKGQFTADIEIGEGERIMNGRFYTQGSRYRMEMIVGTAEAIVKVAKENAVRALQKLALSSRLSRTRTGQNRDT